MVVDYSLTASEVLNLIKNSDLEDLSEYIAPSSAYVFGSFCIKYIITSEPKTGHTIKKY